MHRHTAHKIAFTWILYVLHYMYFNQFHFLCSSLLFSSSLPKFLFLEFIFPSFMWPISYTCTSNQPNLCTCDSLQKEKQIRNLIGKPLACLILYQQRTYMHKYIYIHMYIHQRNHWWWNQMYISCVDRFRFHFRHFQFSNCYYSYIHLLNLHYITLHYISLYFSIENPTKCHTAIYAHFQDARTHITHITHSNWQTSNKSKNICIEMSPVLFVIYICFILIIKMY